MDHEETLKRAKQVVRTERVNRPLLAFALLFIGGLAFFELISARTAVIGMLAPALAGLARPMGTVSRGAPTYAELVELLEAEIKPKDPVIDALTRKP